MTQTQNRKSLFHGEKLRFTAQYPGDAERIARFSEDFDYLRRLDTDFAVPQAIDSKKESSNRGHNNVEFMLRTLEDDRLIGFVALFAIEWNNQAGRLAIGIGDPTDQGKGYGTDALRMVLRYAFHELNLNRVGLDVIEYNEAAVGAYKKVGFKEEGRMRAAVLREGKAYSRIIMGILKEEWETKHSQRL
ncbi:GNAT family N-acetyltransferase [Paenibacillus sp. L3-i20]|uniref:GNAT family N-acetyltransferase n=1 Tax=Paenibacillus sp. L3-i20 TaxID=2905833 RepID=UPI001EDFA694|nr:GNAT family protein [Paenibacillus sp. L3-i20]GKU77401.1 N-acetyltransferase [Paenibacillus sp. L3-i20]